MVIKYINSFFHRHSRWIFGLFTVIIIVAFMDLMTPGQFAGCAGGRGKVGTAFGRTITYEELQKQGELLRLWYRLAQGFEPAELSMQMAFAQLCNLEAARVRGIVASDKEVVEAIRTFPAFRGKDGKFDLELFRKFKANLQENGFGGQDIDECVRNFLVMNKLYAELRDGVIVTDGEVQAFRTMLQETFTVRTALFKTADFAAKVKPVGTELKPFFEAHRDNYKIPQNFQAELVIFRANAPEFVAAAEKEAVPAALKSWYEANSHLFPAPENPKDKKKAPGILPYDKAAPAVRKAFVRERSAALALRHAQQFARELYDVVGEETAENRRAVFDKFLADRKLKTVPTGKVSVTDSKIAAMESPELIRQLSAVYVDLPVSGAVALSDGACVGYVTERFEERRAEFNEVAAKVMADFRNVRGAELARAEAMKVSAELLAMKIADRAAAVRSAKYAFKAIKPFTLSAAPDSEEQVRVMTLARNLEPGALSDIVPTADGSMLLFLESRVPPKGELKQSEAEALRSSYTEAKMMNAYADFQNYVNSQCSLTVDLR